MVIATAGSNEQPTDPFLDLDAYVHLPRLGGLWLSPDGRRIVVGVATPDRENTCYSTALWEVDPDGKRPARRLTRSRKGESAAAFTPSGDLLFTSARPGPDAEDDAEPRTALWLQPAAGGDARVIAKPPGGAHGIVVSGTGTVVAGSGMMPSSAGPDADEDVRKQRKEAGVSAILHEEYPVRWWDHDLGPDRPRLLAADLADDIVGGDAELKLRDLTGHAGRALDGAPGTSPPTAAPWSPPGRWPNAPGRSGSRWRRSRWRAASAACSPTTRTTSTTRRGCPRTAPAWPSSSAADPRRRIPATAGWPSCRSPAARSKP
jgi:hypothetical protein